VGRGKGFKLENLKSFWPYISKYQRELVLGIVALIITDSMTLVVPWLIKEFIDVLPGKPLKVISSAEMFWCKIAATPLSRHKTG